MKLSVIIPAYNSEKTIQKCLQSIRNSTFKDYELIVVDDGSTDNTYQISLQSADRVLKHEKNLSRAMARQTGLKSSRGEIVVFIDSDILVRKDTLEKIVHFFDSHVSVNVLTGLLSEEHPNDDFFSRYKNLYMNYIFRKLPERVSFIFGSIFALRRNTIDGMVFGFDKVEDTALGQYLHGRGQEIAFLKDLEVVHLKKYNFISWMKNDFEVPYMWSQIFFSYKGWEQLGKNNVGFAHSPKEQLLSVAMAPVIVFLLIGSCIGWVPLYVLCLSCGAWALANVSFIYFLMEKSGVIFGFKSIAMTFLDHLVMMSGIASGLTRQILLLVRNFGRSASPTTKV